MNIYSVSGLSNPPRIASNAAQKLAISAAWKLLPGP